MACGSGKTHLLWMLLRALRSCGISVDPRASTKSMYRSPRMAMRRRKAASLTSLLFFIDRTFESKPYFRAKTPTNRANTGKSFWSAFGRSCSLIETTRRTGSTAFTSISNHNNARRTKARATSDFCPVSWMRTVPCALSPNPPISPSTRIIQNKLLKGSLAERRLLLSSLPRLTLMLYELSSPSDGETVEKKKEKLQAASQKFLDMAYAGLPDPNLAKMVIALRTPDYGELLPKMLNTLDESNRENQHYGGWARHSYNDYLKAGK